MKPHGLNDFGFGFAIRLATAKAEAEMPSGNLMDILHCHYDCNVAGLFQRRRLLMRDRRQNRRLFWI